MKNPQGARVGVIGASSLAGRELSKVLKERNFPVLISLAIEPASKEPEIPVLDVGSEFPESVGLESLNPHELDFIFVAAPLSAAEWDQFMGRCGADEGGRAAPAAPVVIALSEFPARAATARKPQSGQAAEARKRGETGAIFLQAPHAASVVLSTLLLRLAGRFPVESSVAHVFVPASSLGPPAIGELQEQILKLMSFQKIPQAVFGNQVAFNMLPRLGGRRGSALLPELELRIHREMGSMLGGRSGKPAVRVLQVPVFFSMAFSLYVETNLKPDPAMASKAIEGDGVELRRMSQPAATQVEAASSADILVEEVAADGSGRRGLWLWAAVDDLHLAAKRAVEIAEPFLKKELLH
jgi:aspartate-semialdehyde dehydrogenase